VKFGTTQANLQSVPAGGWMALVVGETYGSFTRVRRPSGRPSQTPDRRRPGG
jgi:hypothetical protein